MLEVHQRQTASFLKTKVLEIIHSYGIKIEQIFSITCDNGANMLATVKLLKHELEAEMMNWEEAEADPGDDTEKKIFESLSEDFQGQLNLVRCAAHTMQLAILDVVNKTNENIKQITDIVKKFKHIKYRTTFEHYNASYPPVWSQTRWCGIYMMIESIIKQETFLRHLAEEFPELGNLKQKSWSYLTLHKK